MSSKRYQVNEVFWSLQGEGHRAGSANTFVRLSGCNLTCAADGEAGFDCDVEFSSGVSYAAEELLAQAARWTPKPGAVIFTGGEPALQLDEGLLMAFRGAGYGPLCVETNGTKTLPPGLDWISCSPKTAEHTLRVGMADELRYVRHEGMGIPKPLIQAEHLFVSPAFLADGSCRREDLMWCIKLVLENPRWRLSVQQHKSWRVR